MAVHKRHYPELTRKDLFEALRQIRHIINFFGGEIYLNKMQSGTKPQISLPGNSILSDTELAIRMKSMADGILNAEQQVRYILARDKSNDDVLASLKLWDGIEDKARAKGVNIEDSDAMFNFRCSLLDQAHEEIFKTANEDLQEEKKIREYKEKEKYFTQIFIDDTKTNNIDNMAETNDTTVKEEINLFAQHNEQDFLLDCQNCKQWRIKHNYSLTKVAKLIGARYEVVRNIEAGNGDTSSKHYRAYMTYVRANP